jgi:hypothetical protein
MYSYGEVKKRGATELFSAAKAKHGTATKRSERRSGSKAQQRKELACKGKAEKCEAREWNCLGWQGNGKAWESKELIC